MAIITNGLVSPEQSLDIVAKAWGRQRGYCFFPWISGTADTKRERIASYREGPAFYWPRDKAQIVEHLNAHTGDDLYWCPSLFEYKQRKMENAMDEHCLWADLDEVDPHQIKDYPPTIAWETSPERYQALWVLTAGDIQGASWPGKENQRMTYYLGADQAGWDTTQLLRLPGWLNHKPAYRKANGGEAVQGRLLWKNGRRYLSDDFTDLPEIDSLAGYVDDVVEDQITSIDRHEVWARVKLKVTKHVRELVVARATSGNRSEVLWQIERELADAGCNVIEIVAIVQHTVWNKFSGRSDELRRLTIEAAKAINLRSDAVKDKVLEELENKPPVTNLQAMLEGLKPPRWLVKGVLTEGAVGFIAGQPKMFKSWVALDLAISVASGSPFLGTFNILNPGPVLYIQEEDSAPLIKQRFDKIMTSKTMTKIESDGAGGILWGPPTEFDHSLDIDGYIGNSFILSDEGWLEWLDETLTAKVNGKGNGYRLIIFDPLMMMAGDIEDNRAQEMTSKIFRPMKVLARKYGVALQVVNHMKKGDPKLTMRGGQMMLGSVANHAWAEDSLYFTYATAGKILCEQESKNAPVNGFTLSGVRNKNRIWDPIVKIHDEDTDEEEIPQRHQRPTHPKSKILDALKSLSPGAHTVREIADASQSTPAGVYKVMQRAISHNLVSKVGTRFILTGRETR